MKQSFSRWSVALLFILATAQFGATPSHAGVGVAVSSTPVMIIGGVLVGLGIIPWTPVLGAGVAGSLGMALLGPLLPIGVIVLDSTSHGTDIPQFQAISETQARAFGLTYSELKSYEHERTELNAILESMATDLEFASELERLSPETRSAISKVLLK